MEIKFNADIDKAVRALSHHESATELLRDACGSFQSLLTAILYGDPETAMLAHSNIIHYFSVAYRTRELVDAHTKANQRKPRTA